MKRLALGIATLALVACNGDRLTGTAAQDAVAQYQKVEAPASNTPLVFLDGKEISSLEGREVDSKTIESVEVIKGKAAHEKYGARAANGVILITRKAEFRIGG